MDGRRERERKIPKEQKMDVKLDCFSYVFYFIVVFYVVRHFVVLV